MELRKGGGLGVMLGELRTLLVWNYYPVKQYNRAYIHTYTVYTCSALKAGLRVCGYKIKALLFVYIPDNSYFCVKDAICYFPPSSTHVTMEHPPNPTTSVCLPCVIFFFLP
ncbi:hypothetical protein ACN38_g7316 [Penicillium nordicum]|uniref:Uncharacterized protein n=1 Tax=Penicillium nordicum TaxID=229535 RepID=A0A0M9WEL0_9EURO|nr:hypothetical protein ACN38_g7316 [Penicillium nordicum]